MQPFELTHEFLDRLTELIDAENRAEVTRLVAELHPADIAEILEELNNERAQFVFLLLDNEKASDVLAEIDEEERVHFIESFPGGLFKEKSSKPLAYENLFPFLHRDKITFRFLVAPWAFTS